MGEDSPKLVNTLSISFPEFLGEELMMNLDLEGIEVSTGSACSTGSIEPSPVLIGMGYSEKESLGNIRISMGKDNTESEIIDFVSTLEKITSRMSS